MTTTTDVNSMMFHSSSTINGHISPSDPIENGTNDDNEDEKVVVHQGQPKRHCTNPMLNKSFDVLSQIKDNNEILDEKSSNELNILKLVNNIETSTNIQSILPNQVSLDHPHEVPQREENIQPTLSSNDDNQQYYSFLPRVCSIADAPLTLVTSDDLRERSASTESVASSKYDEQQSAKDEEEGTRE